MANITGDDDDNVLDGTNENDMIFGRNGDDEINGGDGNDRLFGEGGHDDLNGDAGTDQFDGGIGDDRLDGGAGFDFAVYEDAPVAVTVDLRTGTATGMGNDTLVSIEGVVGSRQADTLHGDDGDNVLSGVEGDDRMYGHGGDDVIVVGKGGQVIVDGGAGSDTLSFPGATVHFDLAEALATDGYYTFTYGNLSDPIYASIDVTSIENLFGSYATDTLFGNDGANLIVGGMGQDELWGRGGDDTIYGDAIIGFPDAPPQPGYDPDLQNRQGYEDFLHGGAGNDELYGGGGNDHMWGDEGNDMLAGGEGDDWMQGGAGADHFDGGNGNDTADYSQETRAILIDLVNGVAAGAASGDTYVAVEYFVATAFGDVVTGDVNQNRFEMGGGNDIIFATPGYDYIFGQGGDDIFYAAVDSGSAFDGGAGFDIIHLGDAAIGGATVDFAKEFFIDVETGGLGWSNWSNFEGVVGTRYADVITGDGQANLIDGWTDQGLGLNNDILSGMGGNDTIIVGEGNHELSGGDGIDLLRFRAGQGDAGEGTGFTFDLSLQGSAQDTGRGLMDATGFENLAGSEEDDRLSGDGANNVITGDFGNDVIYGNSGADTLHGNAGDDVLYGGSRVDELFGGIGNDELNGGSGNDRINGGSGDDVIDGGGDNDLLIGGPGADTIVGGVGDDQIVGGSGTDMADFSAALSAMTVNLITGLATGEGNDTLTGIENVTGSGSADRIVGDAGHNVIEGRGGADSLYGSAGNDTLNGGTRADELFGGTGDDTMLGENGNDRMNGGSGNDRMDGGSDNDLIIGGPGDDLIIGGLGDDQLAGGSGDDTYLFDAGFGDDVIDGFTAGGSEDALDFSALGLGFADLSVVQQGADTLITTPGGDSVLLLDVIATSLDQGADFVF